MTKYFASAKYVVIGLIHESQADNAATDKNPFNWLMDVSV